MTTSQEPDRPVVGLSSYREPATWGLWSASADLLPTAYALAVEAAGGVPLLLPPTTPYGDAARAVVARLDGLVVSGGADVDPERYGEERHATVTTTRPDRDAWELALLDAAEERGLPVLGVCRGMQLMAVRAGGRLVQHLPDVVGHAGHDPGGDAYGSVTARVEPGSRLATLVGDGPEPGHCHHHQAVAAHPGFTPVAWAPDGTLEAMELPGDRFCLAVQWHPEQGAGSTSDAALLAGLVAAARAYRTPSVRNPA